MVEPQKIDIASGRRVHPERLRFFAHNYLLLALLSVMMFIVGFGAALGIFPGDAMVALPLWIIGAAIIAFSVGHTVLHCNATMIYLTKEELVSETGIVEHHKVRVPIHMITDVKLHRDFVDKLIGTATIHVNTSGGKGYEIFGHFEYPDLDELYNEVFALIRKTPASLPDKDAKS